MLIRRADSAPISNYNVQNVRKLTTICNGAGDMLTATQGDTIYFARRVGEPPVLKQINFYNRDNNRAFSMANVPVDWTVRTLLERVARAECCNVPSFDDLKFLFGNKEQLIELEPGTFPIPGGRQSRRL
jgi:hypothetical protein